MRKAEVDTVSTFPGKLIRKLKTIFQCYADLFQYEMKSSNTQRLLGQILDQALLTAFLAFKAAL